MSIQDDAFDIENIFANNEKSKGFCMVEENDFRTAKEAWDNFRKWAWELEEAYDKVSEENEAMKKVIMIKEKEND